MSADKIEALREDVNEFRQDMRAMSQAVQQLLVSQSAIKHTTDFDLITWLVIKHVQ